MMLDRSSINDFDNWIESAKISGSAFLIDKETGWTSFDVVSKLRYALKIKKVGHAGTLDPLATGLLILCAGAYTKKINDYQALSKTYTGTVKLGFETDSFDAELPEQNPKDVDYVTIEMIYEKIQDFIGTIEQYPPKYSAKRINGVKSYNLARNNIEFEIKPSIVEIYSIVISNFELPFIDFEVKCSKGTYIRSFAKDLGDKLGCGGYLYKLRRTGIGEFTVDNALKIHEIIDLLKINNLKHEHI
jgi:tRNA pseudouridine55 synthase